MSLRRANTASRSAFGEVHNGLEALGVSQSVIEQETVAQSKQFQDDGKGELRHVETGETIVAWLANLRTTKPHWFPDFIDEETAQADEAKAIIDAATLTPTVATISKLFKHVGEAKGWQILEAAGVSITPDKNGNLKPGRKVTVDDKGNATASAPEDKTEARSKNPWSRHYVEPRTGKRGVNFTQQGRIVSALGVEKASAIARAASSFIGATKAYD
jgi:hypothetical protein